ncbi:hypothetical protein RUM43_005847 [Polyplax serrata]
MCPLYPFHIFILYLLILGPLWFTFCTAAIYAAKRIPVEFDPSRLEIGMEETKEVYVYSEDPEMFKHKWTLESDQESEYIRYDNQTYLLNFNTYDNWTSTFNITGNFLGMANVKLRAVDDKNGSFYESEKSLPVTVVRGKKNLDRIFMISIIVLVSILYVTFGCAMDWPLVKGTLRKPVAPIIGFVSQFLFMPLMSYGLGKILFPSSPVERLALFLTGLCPGGGASNIWSIAVDANVNLSITMTTISMVAAFGMYPLWLFTLGRHIFEEAYLETPVPKIASYLVSMLVPVGIGFAIQRFLPRLANVLNAMLKPLSIFLILFIAAFACIVKYYLFTLFTWKVVLAGLALPWLGYFAGFLAAWVLRQPLENILAISIETGIQNTGIAIFMIQLVFGQPTADMVTVIPAAVALMAPIPLAILSVCLKLRKWHHEKKSSWAVSLANQKEVA